MTLFTPTRLLIAYCTGFLSTFGYLGYKDAKHGIETRRRILRIPPGGPGDDHRPYIYNNDMEAGCHEIMQNFQVNLLMSMIFPVTWFISGVSQVAVLRAKE